MHGRDERGEGLFSYVSCEERVPIGHPLRVILPIVDAALKVVDADGLDALSMRRLAEELGCQASALYAHVSGKPELLQLLIDRVAGEVQIPDPDPARWQEQLKETMRETYRVFIAHRDLASAALANIPTGHNALIAMDRTLAILRAGGVPQ